MRIFLILVTLLFVISCGPIHETNNPKPKDIPAASQAELTFANISAKILQPYCITCHRHETAYQNYNIVKVQADQLYFRMITDNPSLKMPKGGARLSTELISLFKQWVDAGAPEVAKTQDGNGEPQEPLISFAEIKNRVLKPNNCIACHSQYNDHTPVRQALGSIVQLITDDKMPYPQNKDGEIVPVKAEDKKLLLKWVEQGAPKYSNRPAQKITTEPLSPTWISLRNNVFGPKCILCHNSYGKKRGSGVALDTHQAFRKILVKNPKFLNFDSPNDSHLIGAILGRLDDDELFFNTMPYSSSSDDVFAPIPAVTEEELAMIEKWIQLKIPYDEADMVAESLSTEPMTPPGQTPAEEAEPELPEEDNSPEGEQQTPEEDSAPEETSPEDPEDEETDLDDILEDLGF